MAALVDHLGVEMLQKLPLAHRRRLARTNEEELKELGEHLISMSRQGDEESVLEILSDKAKASLFVNNLDDESLSALHYAARYNQVAIVKALLQHGADATLQGEEDLTPVHLAARSGHLEVLTMLLASGTHAAGVKDAYHSTPLHFAAMRGHYECADALLKAKGSPKAFDLQLITPMHAAAGFGHVTLVRLLAEKGGEIRARDVDDGTPLHAACMEGFSEVVEALLSLGDPAVLLADIDGDGNTALHLAVEHGEGDLVDLLLERGSNTEALTESNETPLHLAARNGHESIVKALLARGADPHARDQNHQTALHRAAMFGHNGVIEELFKAKVHLDPLDNDSWTPLTVACWKGHADTVRLLLSRNASTAGDRSGKTALHWAVEERHVEVVKVLLENTNEVDLPELIKSSDIWDNTSLHLAAQHGTPAIVKLLLATPQREYLLHAKNDELQNALHLAAKNGRTGTCAVLVKADLTLLVDEDDDSNTPLHLAAENGHFSTVASLLKEGAPVDPRNDNRYTPLDSAAAKGWSKVCLVLLKHQAPVDATDNTKTTPLMLAASFGHTEVVEILLKHHADVRLANSRGLKAIDLAVMHNHAEVCAALLEHPSWARSLAPVPGAGRMTPFKRMIIHQPSAALAALRKFKTRDNDHITFDFSFLDEPVDAIEEDHPLYLMCDYNRGDLIAHPVVDVLLSRKWYRFGAFAYYLSLFVYVVFVAALTGFVVDNRVGDTSSLSSFSTVCQYVIVIFSLCRIVTEVLQMVQEKERYFVRFVNLLEWLTFITSIVFIVPFGGSQSTLQWGFGAIAIFLAWINLVLFVRQFGHFGMYVLMFQEVLKTVLKVLLVFSLFVGGFAGSFYVLLQNRFHFSTPTRSLMKTFVMMTGEFEYSDYFQPNVLPFRTLSFIVFLIFVTIMPIILMNLLVGLAVDDIERIANNALLERRRMSVLTMLPHQRFIEWLRKRSFAKPLLTCIPGDKNGLAETRYTVNAKPGRMRKVLIRMGLALNYDIAEDQGSIVEQLREQNKALQIALNGLQKKLAVVTKTSREQSDLLKAIAHARNIDHELD